MSQALIDIKNLSISFYGEQGPWAVNDISFSLNKGETIGIVGESGSGKSVTSLALLNLLSGVRAIKGEAHFSADGKNSINLIGIDKEKIRTIRGMQIAMIFQEPMTSLNPVITCGEQVSESIMLHAGLNENEAKRQTIALFEKVELPRPEKLYDTYPHQISGGQKQRVMIAMALAGNPKLLIADEPTTALDVTVQKGILRLLKKLQVEYDMGIIFISHDLGVIKEVADKIGVMYKGNLVEQGKSTNIFNNPQHPYTKALIACRPPLDSKPERLSVISDFMGDNNDIVKVSDRTKVFLTDNEIILELKNIEIRYPVKRNLFGTTTEWLNAVNDVSLSIKKGQTIGLVGESGCGKSTIGKAIVKLVKQHQGDILFDGNNINDLSGVELQKYRSNVQLIFQDPYSSLNPRLTIGEAIIEALDIHEKELTKAERKKRALYLLEKVGLTEDQFNKYPHEFSGGQRQRVCIARTLAVNPRLIICDESVAALDVSVQAQVLNLLNDLKQEFGLTYIFISHDLAVIKYMSDYMYIMNKGKIEEQGLPDEIYKKPQSAYTKALIESIPAL